MAHDLEPPERPLEGGESFVWDPGGSAYWRVYHEDYQTPSALHSRSHGPRSRFDHHEPDPGTGEPREDPDGRSAVYLAKSCVTATVEVFADPDPDDPAPDPNVARVCPRHRIAQLRPVANVDLLDLAHEKCEAIGAVAQLSTGSSDDYPVTQQWAQAIYKDLGVPGIHYLGAHDFGDCIVLWERGPKLEVVQANYVPRDWPMHQDEIWEEIVDRFTARNPKRSMVKITTAECPRCRRLNLR